MKPRRTRRLTRASAEFTRTRASAEFTRPRASAEFTRPRARSGFTILEILLALAILLLGLTAVLGLLTFGAALSRTAILRTTAASAAEGVLADLEEELFPTEGGEAGPPIVIEDHSVPGLPDVIYSAHAVENPDDPLEYRVDVEMSWKSAGVRRERRFSALMLREIPFGERFRRDLVTITPAASIPAAPTNKVPPSK